MSTEEKKRGRKIKTIDISTLIDINEVREEKASPYFLTCSICGSTKNITSFREKYVCSKCIQHIRGRK